MKFRKKPVVIDAWRIPFDSDETTQEIPGWIMDSMASGKLQLIGAGGKTYIQTLEGTLTADQGDWVIKGVKGEIYACKPDIFAQTYDPA